jgi:putative chitinase
MNFPVPCSVISDILGNYGPPTNVAKSWPLVEAALDARSIYSSLCAVAAIATISVESDWFWPTKKKYRNESHLRDLYENREDLGNLQRGDGTKFLGRGFIPIIGRRSYEYFGMEIGKYLLCNPDLVLDPEIAAAILAVYFRDRDVRAQADRQNWRMVRLRVNSTATDWPRFFDVVLKLTAALKIPRRERAIEETR